MSVPTLEDFDNAFGADIDSFPVSLDSDGISQAAPSAAFSAGTVLFGRIRAYSQNGAGMAAREANTGLSRALPIRLGRGTGTSSQTCSFFRQRGLRRKNVVATGASAPSAYRLRAVQALEKAFSAGMLSYVAGPVLHPGAGEAASSENVTWRRGTVCAVADGGTTKETGPGVIYRRRGLRAPGLLRALEFTRFERLTWLWSPYVDDSPVWYREKEDSQSAIFEEVK